MDKFDSAARGDSPAVMSQRRQRQIIVVVGLMAIGAIANC